MGSIPFRGPVEGVAHLPGGNQHRISAGVRIEPELVVPADLRIVHQRVHQLNPGPRTGHQSVHENQRDLLRIIRHHGIETARILIGMQGVPQDGRFFPGIQGTGDRRGEIAHQGNGFPLNGAGVCLSCVEQLEAALDFAAVPGKREYAGQRNDDSVRKFQSVLFFRRENDLRKQRDPDSELAGEMLKILGPEIGAETVFADRLLRQRHTLPLQRLRKHHPSSVRHRQGERLSFQQAMAFQIIEDHSGRHIAAHHGAQRHRIETGAGDLPQRRIKQQPVIPQRRRQIIGICRIRIPLLLGTRIAHIRQHVQKKRRWFLFHLPFEPVHELLRRLPEHSGQQIGLQIVPRIERQSLHRGSRDIVIFPPLLLSCLHRPDRGRGKTPAADRRHQSHCRDCPATPSHAHHPFFLLPGRGNRSPSPSAVSSPFRSCRCRSAGSPSRAAAHTFRLFSRPGVCCRRSSERGRTRASGIRRAPFPSARSRSSTA